MSVSHQPAWGATYVASVAYSCACGKQVMWNHYHKGVYLSPVGKLVMWGQYHKGVHVHL